MDNYADGGADRSRKRGRDESEDESASGSDSESGSEVNHQSVEEMAAEHKSLRAQLEQLRAEAAARDFEADQEDGIDIGTFKMAIDANEIQISTHQAQIEHEQAQIRDLRRDARSAKEGTPQPQTYSGPDHQRHATVLRRAGDASSHRSERGRGRGRGRGGRG